VDVDDPTYYTNPATSSRLNDVTVETGLLVNGDATATSFIKGGGTATEFLKADGSVDSTAYLSEHPDTSTLDGGYGGANPITYEKELVKTITVDSNGHVTNVEVGVIDVQGEGGIKQVAAPTDKDLALAIDNEALRANFGSIDGTINIQYDEPNDIINLTANAQPPTAGTNINIPTNTTTVNLNDNIELTGSGTIKHVDNGNVWSEFNQNGLELRVPYGSDMIKLAQRNQIETRFWNTGPWYMLGFPDYTSNLQSLSGIKYGVNDGFGSGGENHIGAEVVFGNSRSAPAGFYGPSVQIRASLAASPSVPNAYAAPGLYFETTPFNDAMYESPKVSLIPTSSTNAGIQGGVTMSDAWGFSYVSIGGGPPQYIQDLAYSRWAFGLDFDGNGLPALHAYIDSTDLGLIQTTNSDYRIKQNISDIEEGAIDRVMSLRPIQHNWKSTEEFGDRDETILKEGFIAHEVAEVIPSGVSGEKDGQTIQALQLDSIVAVLTKAIQEQQETINALKSEIEILKSK
jgi:hypothetical protein